MTQTEHSCTAGHLPRQPSGLGRWAARLSLDGVLKMLERLDRGRMTVHLPDGSRKEIIGRTDGPHGECTIHDLRAIHRLVTGGHIGFAESYIDGDWDTPDLPTFLLLGQTNEHALRDGLSGGWIARLFYAAYKHLHANTRGGSKRNIAAHYDLGNAFYERWLDPSMTYSSALFTDATEALEAGQAAKYRRIGELAGLEAGASVLEIGCGWGGFMEHAAEAGCQVEGITLSREQLAFANERMERTGLSNRARASYTDYRDTGGEYDAVVSIEMLEAVGEAHWPRYFEVLRNRLKRCGAAVVQVITMDDERFETYRRQTDFIQRHVFPGGMLPSPQIMHEQAKRAGLRIDHVETFGQSYARTLAEWRVRFNRAWSDIQSLGFDERFRRLWNYYLGFCEAGFTVGTIDVGIYRLRLA